MWRSMVRTLQMDLSLSPGMNIVFSVKFEALAVVHGIKIIFFWVITLRLVKIKNQRFRT